MYHTISQNSVQQVYLLYILYVQTHTHYIMSIENFAQHRIRCSTSHRLTPLPPPSPPHPIPRQHAMPPLVFITAAG